MEFTKKISYSMANGKTIVKIKTFRNLHHFDNYYNKLIKSGCNVIDLTNYYSCGVFIAWLFIQIIINA